MYGYEIWLEGNCLRDRSDAELYTEVEAEEEAYAEVLDLLHEEGYAEDGYDDTDFEIKTIEY